MNFSEASPKLKERSKYAVDVHEEMTTFRDFGPHEEKIPGDMKMYPIFGTFFIF